MPPLPPGKSYMRVASFRGSRPYAADEYLDGELGPKLDVFSLGVVRIITLNTKHYSGNNKYLAMTDSYKLCYLANYSWCTVHSYLVIIIQNSICVWSCVQVLAETYSGLLAYDPKRECKRLVSSKYSLTVPSLSSLCSYKIVHCFTMVICHVICI